MADISKLNINKIKKFYDRWLWTKEQVHEAVVKCIITEEEYEEIIHE